MRNITAFLTESALLVKVTLYVSLVFSNCGIVLAQGDVQHFSVGFSRSLFTNVNHNDAGASIKAWAQMVARERKIDVNPSAQLFDNVEEMTYAMSRGRVDSIGMTFTEYMTLAAEVEINHCFLTQTAGAIFEKYVLLARDGAGTENLQDLRGSNLNLHDSARTSLAMHWLDSIIRNKYFPASVMKRFSSIKHFDKISGAVLPVFFGKDDACLVTESGFITLIELNPQIGRKLRIIAKSRPLVPAVLCFRKNFNSPQKEQILAALRMLHSTAAGQQVLTIFQAEALVEVESNVLEETRIFLAEAFKIHPVEQISDTDVRTVIAH